MRLRILMEEHISGLYARRNALYLRGDEHIFLVLAAIGIVSRLDRKANREKEAWLNALSSLFARGATLAFSLGLPISEALCRKYPATGCAYCRQPKCICDAHHRPDIGKEDLFSERQTDWSLSEWCAHIHAIYGDKNIERGLTFAIARLTEEFIEAVNCLTAPGESEFTKTLDGHRTLLAKEFADFFAWIFAIAGMFELGEKLEERIIALYKICPGCQSRPCNCRTLMVHADMVTLPLQSRANTVTP